MITVGSALLRVANRDGTRQLIIDDGGAGNATAPPVIKRAELLSGTTDAGIEPVVSLKYRSAQAAAARGLRQTAVGR